MDNRNRLKELRKEELIILARRLKARGWGGLGKESLIDHIIDKATEQDIAAALNGGSQDEGEKKGWWETHKIACLIVIIGIIGSLASIISLIQPTSIDFESAAVVDVIIKKNTGFSLEDVSRLNEKVTELETALNNEKSGNTQDRKEALEALKKGELTKAQDLFKKAIEKDNDRIETDKANLAENYLNLGNAYYLGSKFDEALEAYNKAIEIKPDDQSAWNNKGNALRKLGRRDEALEAYNKAIAIKPDYHEAWSNKGVTLAALGRRDEALEAYNKAIAVKPDDADAWYNLACLYSLKKEKGKALEYLRKAIEKGFNDFSLIKTDKDLDFIRTEKEFQEIIEKL